MKRRIIALICAVVLFASLPSLAQEELSENCDLEGTWETVGEMVAETEVPIVDMLYIIRELVTDTIISCTGMSFDSETEGLQPVIGPVDIPAGFYRVTVTTTGFFALYVTPLSGECGSGTRMSATSVFNVSRGEADSGAQATVGSEGCSAVLEISNVSEPWTLTFEKLN